MLATFDDARSLLASLRSQPLQLDLVVCSFPCTDETILQGLNNYPPSSTADLFRGPLRFQLMDATNASMIVDENVPPHSQSWQHHDAVRMKAHVLGLNSRVSYLDVTNVGAATSRERWIHFSSRFPLPAHVDIAQLSGMSSLSKPVSDILEPAASIPSTYWITDANVAHGLLDDAFHSTQWHGTRIVDHATVHIAMRTYTYPTSATIPPHISEHLVRLSCALPSPTILDLCQTTPRLHRNMTSGHTAPQRIRLWWLLNRCFGSSDIYADSFEIYHSIRRPPAQHSLSFPLSQHCVALLRLGYHCAPGGESALLRRIPTGSPVKLSDISIDNDSDDTVCLPPTSGVIIMILANCHHQLDYPDCSIATAINNTYPGLFDVRISNTDRVN